MSFNYRQDKIRLSPLIILSICSAYKADQDVEGSLELELEQSFDEGLSWSDRGVTTRLE